MNIEKKKLHDGFLKVYSVSTSDNRKYELMERPDCASVLIYDETDVVVLRQFRPGSIDHDNGAHVIELVAGLIDKGESPIEAAIRETEEETGLIIDQSSVRLIGVFYLSPGGSNERTHLFLAKADLNSLDTSKVHGLASEREQIYVSRMEIKEALKLTTKEPCNITLRTALLELMHINK